MTTRLISAATVVMAIALLIAGNAWAEEFDPCTGLTGKAKGLCTAYTKGMGCSSDSSNAPEAACANVATMLEEVTGFPPPSDCPCDFSLARIRDPIEGWSAFNDFQCTEVTTLDPGSPPGVFPSGIDIVTLSEDPPVVPIDFARSILEWVNEKDSVQLLCQYFSESGSPETFFGFAPFFDPDYLTLVDGLMVKQEACKGAIGILAANVNLVSGNCTF